MSELGEQIRQLRKSKKMNQDELAAAVGVTKASISSYETGKRIPQHHVLQAISEALDVRYMELLSYLDQKEDDVGAGTMNGLPPHMQNSEVPGLYYRMHMAFNRLSDEAQITAVERIEELAMIPKYQRSLENVLRSYIKKRYNLEYDLLEDLGERKIYRDDADTGSSRAVCDVRHIILKRDINQKARKIWEFYSYSFHGIGDNDADLMYAISRLGDAYEPGCNLGFVFDEQSVISSFYKCYAEQDVFISPDRKARGYNKQVLFLEINNDLGITDVMDYDPDR